jgi:hypothetical protein
MTGVTPNDRTQRSRATERDARRSGWFSRPKLEVRYEDQEAEVREQLYSRPAPAERTVRMVQPVQQPQRFADRPAA